MRTLLLAALLLAAPPALAARPSRAAALLEDAATFRAALPSVAANLLIVRSGSTTAARLERTEGQLLLTGADGAEHTATSSAADSFSLRLLGLALGATPPATAGDAKLVPSILVKYRSVGDGLCVYCGNGPRPPVGPR